jgi:hypothetical protein
MDRMDPPAEVAFNRVQTQYRQQRLWVIVSQPGQPGEGGDGSRDGKIQQPRQRIWGSPGAGHQPIEQQEGEERLGSVATILAGISDVQGTRRSQIEELDGPPSDWPSRPLP